MERRSFLQYTGTTLALHPIATSGLSEFSLIPNKNRSKIRIKKVAANFDRESTRPYKFKGGATTEKWHTMACLETESGVRKVGVGNQGILWSDKMVGSTYSESAGNAMMYSITEIALQILKGESFADPHELLDTIFPEVYSYAKKITQNPDLQKTFVLNALVCVDNAAWLLYADANNIKTFDEMIPGQYKQGLSQKHKGVASIPSFPNGADVSKLVAAVDEGHFILKLKIGAAGTQEAMLLKDQTFLKNVHEAIGHRETPHTSDGKIPYYLDANGRYEKKETLLRFLDYAKKIGAHEQISVIEEPFSENNREYVGDVGVRIASDESSHTVEDAAHRIELGYKAFALKAIAKTLSMTMRIAQLAYEKDIPCFCADLTVNPLLVDWNKNIAARLPLFPGMKVGLLEANGHQNYRDWDKLVSYHPMPNAGWIYPENGVFNTSEPFFKESGGVLKSSEYYGSKFPYF